MTTALVLLVTPPAVMASPVAGAPIPGTSCKVFPSTSIWNTRVDGLPLDPRSDAWLASMNAAYTNLHPDFGKPPYGLPFAVVDNSHPVTRIRFSYASESDKGPYPFGPDIPLEQGSDRHALMINKDTCVLFELFNAHWHGGRPWAGSGAIFDLSSNHLRPNGWTSADAAGLPIFPGLVRYDEVQGGSIDHAIRFTAEPTDASHLWPARHDAGTPNPALPPMGARFRLKADFSLAGYSNQARVILLAMKEYGLILADNGSDWFFQGTEDSSWPNSLLDELKTVPASAFEAVDESGCRVKPDSGKASCP